jgi:ribosomal protein L35AE/L33A
MKRTRWYSRDQKPAYVGVYERKFGKASSYFPNTTFFTRWDGKNWRGNAVTVNGAEGAIEVAFLQCLPWRGLVK